MSKVVYELKRYHHHREWRKGDLEAANTQDLSMVFKTRKAANMYLATEKTNAYHANQKNDIELVHRGDKNSELIVWTGDEWVHENTGEKEYEYYWYVVKKINL